jgi:dTDP-4-amino-4,6-dideoxygalactose transaminase
MLLYQQTPVGEKIKLGKPDSDNGLIESFFRPYTIKFYDSGTSALAAAILACINKKNIKTPEIIMPAYSCPDLVSAILYAGGNPVLVDFVENRPWMDLDQLQEKITSNTIAVIAVNLFGIPERLQAIKKLTEKKEILLIEDSAQSFAISGNSIKWSGDIVILSFGRGKPVNMLNGGSVLFHEKNIGELLPTVKDATNAGIIEDIKYRIKAGIYNLTISPYLYGYLEKLPFLHVGETRFKNLRGIEAMNAASMVFLYHNIKLFSERKSDLLNRYTELLSSVHNDKLIDLPKECRDKNIPYLLRYPLLCSDIEYRDELYRNLRSKGIGVSKMYQSIIPTVKGMKSQVSMGGTFKNSVAFADRLITLSMHSRTTDLDLKHIRVILSGD